MQDIRTTLDIVLSMMGSVEALVIVYIHYSCWVSFGDGFKIEPNWAVC